MLNVTACPLSRTLHLVTESSKQLQTNSQSLTVRAGDGWGSDQARLRADERGGGGRELKIHL